MIDASAYEDEQFGLADPASTGSGWAFIFALAGVFIGGLALNLTPCVYPLIPITVSYFGGRSTQNKAGLMGHGICYILGLAMTNSLLGVFAALTGGLVGGLLQNPVVLAGIAIVLLAFASSLFGIWELRLPYWLTQAAAKSYTGFLGTFFAGATLGLVAAPCIGPFVLGLLTWVAATGDPLKGFFVFFILSIGMGLPLLILALFSGQLARLPKSGDWMNWVRRLMGWVLVAMAAYFVRPVFPLSVQPYMLGGVALAAGIHLGWLDRTVADFKAFAWIKVMVGTACLILGMVQIRNQTVKPKAINWQPYSEQLLVQAVADQMPVIIDFSAEWCTPCRKLDEITFQDPDVVRMAKEGFVMVKVDLTGKESRQFEPVLASYNVKGVPTVVFIDKTGLERNDLRVVDFIKPDAFLNRMVTLK